MTCEMMRMWVPGWGDAGQRVISALSPEQPSLSGTQGGKVILALGAWFIPPPPHF